jgi:hypothetical protein
VIGDYQDIPPEEAAVGQLETAIELWFNEKDAASIHTLAAAAAGMLETIARDRRIQLRANEKTKQFLKTKPQWFQDYMRDPQNYFKHGNPKLKKGYHARHSEVIMMGAVAVCSELFGGVSPMMATFIAHLAIDDDKISELLTEQMEAVLVRGGEIEDFAALDRQSFFKKAFPLFLNRE